MTAVHNVSHVLKCSELLKQTCQVANVLKNQCGVVKGDTVVICMPAMPLAVCAMLACARIGAVHRFVPSYSNTVQLYNRVMSWQYTLFPHVHKTTPTHSLQFTFAIVYTYMYNTTSSCCYKLP